MRTWLSDEHPPRATATPAADAATAPAISLRNKRFIVVLSAAAQAGPDASLRVGHGSGTGHSVEPLTHLLCYRESGPRRAPNRHRTPVHEEAAVDSNARPSGLPSIPNSTPRTCARRVCTVATVALALA